MNGKIIENMVWIILGIIYLLTVKHEDSVIFLDVGQGDAILIQEGSTQVLIDGGPDDSVLYELQKYIPLYDRKIEYVILSHPHDDHLVGLLSILKRYEVGEILYYPVCYNNDNYGYLIQKYPNMREVGGGDTIRLDSFDINILWPILNREGQGCVGQYNSDLNNDSLVLSFEYLDKKFLLMGDAEASVEQALLTEDSLLDGYDVLKAGHHCSNSSSSETFVKRVSPAMAVCSVGLENSFGHPHSETLEIFSKYNVQYLLTSKEGNIQIK